MINVITPIEKMYAENKDLLDFLTASNEITHRRVADDSFRKGLALSSASLFETLLTDALVQYANYHSSQNQCLMSMLKVRVFTKQFHTFFEWKDKNAGSFFKLLGEELGETLKRECKNEPLKTALSSFLELGQLRNELVHQNFVTYPLEKTAQEVFELYSSALVFVVRVQKLLRVPPEGLTVSKSAPGVNPSNTR